MEERGANTAEVLKTVETGRQSEAKFGRMKYGLTFACADTWRGRYYLHKHIDAYCVLEGADIIVVTVVVKYF